jgi:MFS family permease
VDRLDDAGWPAIRRDGLGQARAATWVAFFVTGLVAATWAARIPAVQDRLGLSPGGLAVAVLAIEGGALLGLPLGGALVTRRGSRYGLRAGFAVYPPGLLVVAVAPTLVWLAVGLAVWAVANSVVDVGLNAQGVELDRRYGRPVLSSLHAAQGTGLLAGALTATAAASLDVPLVLHVAVVAALGLAAGWAATFALLEESSRQPGARMLTRPGRGLLLLGAVAFCAFLVDGAATNWIAVHLRTEHHAGAGVAAAGYLVFTAALVAGRLQGDRLAAHFSRIRVVQACGCTTAAGVSVAVLAPTVPLALAGWALVGLSVAPLAPTVLGAAPGVARLPAPAAIATVTTVGYLGSFTGPPLVGVVAEVTSLSTALVLLAGAGVAAALLARLVRPDPPRGPV